MFGTGIFPTSAGTDLVAAITTAISDNISVVLTVFGFMVGLGLVLRLFRKSAHGKI